MRQLSHHASADSVNKKQKSKQEQRKKPRAKPAKSKNFASAMNSNKKAQFFRMIHAKKKNKEKNDEKQSKSKSISSYFISKTPSIERSKESEDNLKRKLELFKYDAKNDSNKDISEPKSIVSSPKRAKIDKVEEEEKVNTKTNSNNKKMTPLEQQVKVEILKNLH